MKNYLKYFVLLISFLMFSCKSAIPVSQGMESWIGATKHDIILQWGPPNQTNSDGNNGEVFTYKYLVPTTSHSIKTRTSHSSSQRQKLTHVYVNSAGIIYSYKTNYKHMHVKSMNQKKSI